MCVPQCVYMWIESPQYEYFLCTAEPTPERLSLIDPCGRVRHPDPVRRVAGGDPRGHADEVLDVEVEHVRPVEVVEDRRGSSRGVIQFSRPISSRGPQGLFETLTPPRLRTASGTSSLSRGGGISFLLVCGLPGFPRSNLLASVPATRAESRSAARPRPGRSPRRGSRRSAYQLPASPVRI